MKLPHHKRTDSGNTYTQNNPRYEGGDKNLDVKLLVDASCLITLEPH